ncbi:hypothetical protein Skr01_29120 [Sphaerisporangium krabiense]|uniref:DUF1931 domain-containing protein n=1 Tax=Sphaerisporangium krabiense TaxID=763782 RepID=A0A7W8Z9Z5_9ACTN|nr:DUF1931 family protein [Sphaerisporangium krabiense]MBB5630222.1 hypothetical protein [Sphaerisporangium krabiense]GII62827.1 hypothetical protein Skr01_29120 [Sphaerisporangium krabiense]
MVVMAVPRFERLFRSAAGVDVDKDDLRRYGDFVNGKVHDLLLIGQAHAKANRRDIIEPWDLPVTKGLQESIHRFGLLDEDIELKPILEQLAALPPLDLSIGEETIGRLPEIVGGLSVALARTFKIVDPDVKNPATEQWERAIDVFDLLL